MNINENLDQFKKAVSDTCKLFKTMFQDDRNVIISKDNINYINNIEQLFDLKTKNSDVYKFGVNYTLTQIQNFRENICINPILYILAFEQLIEQITDLRQLEKFNFKKVVDSLQWYYDESKLSKAKVTKQHIKRLFFKEYEDSFLAKVIDIVSNPSNVEIVQSKTNTIIKHKYYKLKVRHQIGTFYGTEYKIFIVNILTKELFTELVNLAIPILVLCNYSDFEINNSYNLAIFNITPTELIKHYHYICMLTGFGRGFQNLDIDELNSYSFGEIKEFKFVEGILQFSGHISFSAKEIEKLNKKETMYQYYALQGKNVTINTTEEYLERVKCIVSTIKALQNNGIFYTETKTLKIIERCYQVADKELSLFIKNLLYKYLLTFRFNIDIIHEVIDDGNLSASFNVYTGKYDDEIFTSLDYYLNIFGLLDSNVKTLSKLN